MNDVNLYGAWTSEMYAEHLPESSAFDRGLIDYIIKVCHPQKVLDLGCGQGFFIKYLRDKGIDAWGVEGEDLTTVFQAPGYQIKQDLSELFDLKEKYDLVMCLEVVEHIPHEFEDTVFNNIVKHMSRYLLFSGAIPGQQGTGHINERLESHWFSQLAKRGLVLRHQDTVQARFSSIQPWYKNNASLWEIIHPEAHEVNNLIAERDSQIITTEKTLQQVKANLNTISGELHNLKLQLESKTQEIERLQNIEHRITAMESSKFWKLRSQWFKLKKLLGIKANE